MNNTLNDFIRRDAAIAFAISGRTREIDGEKWIRVSEVRESLLTMQLTAKKEKTGEWLVPQRRDSMSWNEKAYAECSICHEVIFDARSMKFCPQCGAKMVNKDE